MRETEAALFNLFIAVAAESNSMDLAGVLQRCAIEASRFVMIRSRTKVEELLARAEELRLASKDND
jgi:BMFP domain-containing protein YqiC